MLEVSMKKLSFALVALLVATSLAVPSTGVASDKFANKGQVELGGMLNFSSNTHVTAGSTGDAATTVTLSPFVGYFLFDQFELGLNLQLNSTTFKGNTTSDYTLLLSPAWNFRIQNSNVTPAVAFLIGYGSTSPSGGVTASGLSVGGRATLKIQVVSNANLHVGGEYLMNTRNPSGWSGERNGNNIFNLDVGFSIFFP
jgi:hypothetical protein